MSLSFPALKLSVIVIVIVYRFDALVCLMADFPADLQALYVEELSETLPTCVCYHVERLGKYFWALEYFFDALSQALPSDDVPELNKFTNSVRSRLDQQDAKNLLGENCVHMKPPDPRWELGSFYHSSSSNKCRLLLLIK